MDRFRPDEDNSIEPSQLTAEEILAEFLADLEQEQAAAPREVGAERSAGGACGRAAGGGRARLRPEEECAPAEGDRSGP